jgi:disulfide bond formation protein DsbB
MALGETMTTVLAAVTLIGNVGSIALFASRLFARSTFKSAMILIARWALPLGFLLTFGSLVGSLVYSEVVGFPACILCWMNRIFMYPMPFLFGLAYWRKESTIFPYTFFLSLIGVGIAGYQWGKEMLLTYGGVSLPCPAVAGLPPCDRLYVFEYGYVTIAMIALNAFIWTAIVSWAGLRYRQAV